MEALIYYSWDGVSDKVRVNAIHYELDSLTEEQRLKGELVTIPPKETYSDKTGILYINPFTKELWWEYVYRTPTPEEELQQLKERIQIMQKALDDLVLGGM